MSVKYCLPVLVFYFWRKLQRILQRSLSAIAEHFVERTEQNPNVPFLYKLDRNPTRTEP